MAVIFKRTQLAWKVGGLMDTWMERAASQLRWSGHITLVWLLPITNNDISRSPRRSLKWKESKWREQRTLETLMKIVFLHNALSATSFAICVLCLVWCYWCYNNISSGSDGSDITLKAQQDVRVFFFLTSCLLFMFPFFYLYFTSSSECSTMYTWWLDLLSVSLDSINNH